GRVERAFARRRERDLRANCDCLAVGAEDALEWRAGRAEQPYVETGLARANFRGKRGVRRASALEQLRVGRSHDPPARRHARAGGDCLPHRRTLRERAYFGDRESGGRTADAFRRLEAESIADFDRRAHVDDQFAALVTDDRAQYDAAIVRLRSRDVVTPVAAAVHPAGEAAAEDLHERLDFLVARTKRFAALDVIQELAIGFCNGRDVFGLLLPPLHLETAHARLGDRGEMLVGAQVFARDEIPAVELRAVRDVGQDVILAA